MTRSTIFSACCAARSMWSPFRPVRIIFFTTRGATTGRPTTRRRAASIDGETSASSRITRPASTWRRPTWLPILSSSTPLNRVRTPRCPVATVCICRAITTTTSSQRQTQTSVTTSPSMYGSTAKRALRKLSVPRLTSTLWRQPSRRRRLHLLLAPRVRQVGAPKRSSHTQSSCGGLIGPFPPGHEVRPWVRPSKTITNRLDQGAPRGAVQCPLPVMCQYSI
mmetsp:Transcript_33617/g.78650  ORF Transcript_33617/g.78650 Transcript_33617/m.78650 type:complete len:222 (-) Transcript_33617:201-866(-)